VVGCGIGADFINRCGIFQVCVCKQLHDDINTIGAGFGYRNRVGIIDWIEQLGTANKIG
jgi:hypothetical protein